MTLLPEVEDRLVAVAEQRFGEQPHRRRARWRLPRRTRPLALALGSLLLAVPAVAATHAWEPLLGKPSVDGNAPRVAADAIPEEQRELLSVLRRSQTEQDHSAATLGLLEPLAPTTDGVRLQGVRLLGGRDGVQVALIPVAKLYKRMPDQGGELLARDALCLTDATNVTCATTDQARAGALTGFEGSYAYGVVPDGVAVVRLDYASGRSVSIPVHDNFYGAKLAKLPTLPTPAAGRITLMLQRDPVTDTTPRAPATITWLDAQGNAVPDPTDGR